MFQSEPRQEADPSTPDTTLVVGLIFGATLFSVVAFLVFKRVRGGRHIFKSSLFSSDKRLQRPPSAGDRVIVAVCLCVW